MNKIENAQQLRKEIVRLQTELEKKELKLQSSFNTVKEDFKPETFIVKAISSATGINFAKGDFLKTVFFVCSCFNFFTIFKNYF